MTTKKLLAVSALTAGTMLASCEKVYANPKGCFYDHAAIAPCPLHLPDAGPDGGVDATPADAGVDARAIH